MMTSQKLPVILHVDDEPDDLRAWSQQINEGGRVKLLLRHPNEVVLEDVLAASLVLVDYRIANWPERAAAAAFTLKPPNGLSLLSILQESTTDDAPRAFSLYTAALHDLARDLTPQPYIVARAHNLEWIFDKSHEASLRLQRVADLAIAVENLPRQWPSETGQAEVALKAWLRLPDSATWTESAWNSILRCRAPMHDFAQSTRGIGVLRWMLQRILPYPTFLYDDARLSARLRVDIRSLVRALDTSKELQSLFESARYTGNLADFMGRRWWRSGVEAIIFALASEDPADLCLLHSQLRSTSPSLVFLSNSSVFPVLGPGYVAKNELASANEVVEVVPDDWPPYADTAWALRSDLEDHYELRAVALLDEPGQG